MAIISAKDNSLIVEPKPTELPLKTLSSEYAKCLFLLASYVALGYDFQWVGYFIYFKFTLVFLYLMFLIDVL